MVAIGEHYRPADAGDVEPGVYRVVGAGEPVALLRVGTPEGKRAVTGDLVRVDAATLDATFEHTADPAAGLNPIAAVRNAGQGLYWQFRRFR